MFAVGRSVLLLSVAPAIAGTVEVRIEKMKFVPKSEGQKGRHRRLEELRKRGYHTVWFSEEGVAESEPMFPDESWKGSSIRAGECSYLCGLHPDIWGKTIVE